MSFADLTASRLELPRISSAYATTLFLGLAFAAAPLAIMTLAGDLLALPQPMLFPAGLAALVVALYLAARLTALLALAGATGRVPPLAAWRLPRAMGFKLAAALLAPWPFDAAFWLIGRFDAPPSALAQAPIFLLAAAAALAGVALLLALLAETWRLLRPMRASGAV